MDENIGSPTDGGDSLPPNGMPDDMETLTAQAKEDAGTISRQVQEVATRVAALVEAEKQMESLLADIRGNQAEVTATATAAATAKADIRSRVGAATTQATRITEAHQRANQVCVELEKALTSATQHATEAEGFKTTTQSASEAATAALAALQTTKDTAKGEAAAVSTALSSATAAAEATKALAAKAETIEQRVADYEARLAELDTRCTNQLKTINDLLPGAASAGLAHAFNERRKTFLNPGKHWEWFFVGSLVALVLLAGSGLFHSFFSNTAPTIEEVLVLWLTRLPVAATLAWLALHASRESALAKRLEEDYGFKAATAASFQGFHQKMAEMGAADAANAPLSKLCEDTLSTIANPPGRIYDRHELGVSPTAEIASTARSLAEALKAVKTPG